MGRPGCGCCNECACVYKVDKNTGNIVWAKNLGFDATAVYKYEDRIYVAIDYHDEDETRNGEDLIAPLGYNSIYDIIVLDLSGNILEEECITFLPKARLPDVDDNDEDYHEIKLPINMQYPNINALYVFKYSDVLYINVIMHTFVVQIVDKSIKYIGDLKSLDNHLDGTDLVFTANNYNTLVREELGYIYIFSINEITIKKYDYLNNQDLPSHFIDKFNPETFDLSQKLIALNLDNFEYETIDKLYEYSVESDNDTYITYRFDFDIRNVIFPIMRFRSYDIFNTNFENSYLLKPFHTTCSSTSTGYVSYGIFKDDTLTDLEDHAKVLLQSEKPIVPNISVCRLDLLNFTYLYQRISYENSLDNLISMTDITEINNKDITFQTNALRGNTYNPSVTNYVKYRYPIIALGPGTLLNNPYIVNDDPSDYTYYPDRHAISANYPVSEPILLEYKEEFGSHYHLIDDGVDKALYGPVSHLTPELTVVTRKNFNLKINQNINCGLFEDLDNELASINHIYHIDNGIVTSSNLDQIIDYTNSQSNIAECKTTNIKFLQTSKSYIDKDGKKCFNAIMTTGWTVYQNLYSIVEEFTRGDSLKIESDVILFYLIGHSAIYNGQIVLFSDVKYFDMAWDYYSIYTTYPSDYGWTDKNDEDFISYASQDAVIPTIKSKNYGKYSSSSSARGVFYGNKIIPYRNIYTDVTVLIKLDEKTGIYRVVQTDDIDVTNTDFIEENISPYNEKGLILSPSSAKSNLSYTGVESGFSGNITVEPDILRYKYRDYNYDIHTFVNRNETDMYRNEFSNHIINEYAGYIQHVGDIPNTRLMCYDSSSEYLTTNVIDGNSINGGIYIGSYQTIDELNRFYIVYNYTNKSNGDFILKYYSPRDSLYYTYSGNVYITTGSDIVNFMNNHGGDNNIIKDGVIANDFIVFSSNSPTNYLNIVQTPYEEEKYNIMKFTDGNIQWKSNFLMQPRPLNDFTNDNREYNAYHAQDNIYPLDITQDNDYLYVTSNKRKNGTRSQDIDKFSAIVSDSKTLDTRCGVITDKELLKLIDFPQKKKE